MGLFKPVRQSSRREYPNVIILRLNKYVLHYKSKVFAKLPLVNKLLSLRIQLGQKTDVHTTVKLVLFVVRNKSKNQFNRQD